MAGKTRCGYYNTVHEDSDRFVFRRCSDSLCDAYDGNQRIQLAAYSYDNGLNPYSGEDLNENESHLSTDTYDFIVDDPSLLKVFSVLLEPLVEYILAISMDISGVSSFILMNSSGGVLETQDVQHNTKCEENYFEGYVLGLYFGGDCRAPVDLGVDYVS